ncbi:AMP-binding protein [Methylotenera sp. G11]|uniref:AMP-binding protein n=1 Tax=Methylotenera sp. G11 TaxID=1506585 RepID=UPI0006911EC3|nr:AMP-binding protein [Methylotenera sp. G11]
MTVNFTRNALLQAVRRNHPEQIALHGTDISLTYAELATAVSRLAEAWAAQTGRPQAAQPATIGLAVENHPAWIVLDLAAMACSMPLVPLPFFFSREQWLHAMQDAGVSILVTDQPQLFEPLLADNISSCSQFELAGKTLTQFALRQVDQVKLPDGTAKITYTSGTTGNPKGVCLSNENMLNVASAITAVTEVSPADRHLSVLPLATLLENVAGVYASLLAGASCYLLPNHETGLSGAVGLDIRKLLATLEDTQASTVIFTPELLHALVVCIESGASIPGHLRFLAVGGASVSPALLERANKLQIPVYEGYGLSECASVVALNIPSGNKAGSAGKPLPHIQLSFTHEHEIVVNGNAYLGYVGQEQPRHNIVHTGDIGELDADGYLIITGRKKNIFITSFGRNVSPEWVERELKITPCIVQAALFGEAKPWNVAIIVPRPAATEQQINDAIQALNARLPDYARISRWILADAPFSARNRQLTSNGRNRRDAILLHYQDRINALYEGISA